MSRNTYSNTPQHFFLISVHQVFSAAEPQGHFFLGERFSSHFFTGLPKKIQTDDDDDDDDDDPRFARARSQPYGRVFERPRAHFAAFFIFGCLWCRPGNIYAVLRGGLVAQCRSRGERTSPPS